MKEPKTIAEAQALTLKKIRECMELPRKERADFWFKTRWPQYKFTAHRDYCAFCIVAEYPTSVSRRCKCSVKEICQWFSKYINKEGDSIGKIFLKKDLRKLYRMVEEIDVI